MSEFAAMLLVVCGSQVVTILVISLWSSILLKEIERRRHVR